MVLLDPSEKDQQRQKSEKKWRSLEYHTFLRHRVKENDKNMKLADTPCFAVGASIALQPRGVPPHTRTEAQEKFQKSASTTAS